MSEETTMTLGDLAKAIQMMADALGPDCLVDVDLEFGDDDPAVLGTIKTQAQGQRYRLIKIERDTPIYRSQGTRTVSERLEEYIQAAQLILAGLAGQPFTWHESTRRTLTWKAKRMGATLVSPSYARELGLRPIDGEQPVGQGEWDFSASRKRRRITWGNLYVMECQLEKIPPREQEEDTVSVETPDEVSDD